MNYSLLTISLILIILSSCTSSRSLASYYSSTAQCVSKNTDGSVSVKSWGTGITFKKAVVNAQQNAIRQILFDGFRSGDLNCQTKPLVPNVNAEDRFQTYFAKSFEDNNFAQYMDLEEPVGRSVTRKYYRSSQGVTTFINVRVNVLELKGELVKNGILK